MPNTPRALLAVVDRRHAKLLKLSRTPHDRLHVEQLDQVEVLWEEHEHDPPSPRVGKVGDALPSDYEREEQFHRSAKAIAEWLEERLQRFGMETLTVFSPPRMLGALRAVWTPRMRKQVQEQLGDFAHLSSAQLSKEAAILTWSELALAASD